jgi:hypothetical protein
MNPVRRIATLALALLAPAALAQQSLYEEKNTTLEAGVRYWVSKGSTDRSHDASGFSCSFAGDVYPCGKPTSTLNYDNLGAHALELFARKSLDSGWFAKGNLGIGVIPNGRLTDQDFVNPPFQDLALETVSGLTGKMYYGSIDVGREVWKNKGGDSTLGLFVGYQRWNETLDANGYMSTTEVALYYVPNSPGENVPVIRNEQVWDAARIGAEMRMVRGRTRATIELAYVPYAQYKNTDNHWLRTDLNGPIVAKGRGHGYQFELELRRRFPDFFDLELGLGYRYWVLSADTGSSTFASDPRSFPIMELSSERQGVMFSLGKSW